MSASTVTARLQRFEFESRIFISFGIVAAACAVSFTVFSGYRSIAGLLGVSAGMPARAAASAGFLLSALLAAAASALRIWSGSVLTSRRMMSFSVRVDALLEEGPYRMVRNPIYLADLVAFAGFAVCLPPCGAVLPVLLYLHYTQIISYEEVSLARPYGLLYENYVRRVPRLLPDRRSLRGWRQAAREFSVSRDGLRHNALYLLFIPGFLLSAATGKLLWAIVIGLPAVLDWAIVHTRIGTARDAFRPESKAASQRVVKSKPAKVFRGVLYAQCWEDPEIDRVAFRLARRDSLFSITSGGCNVLAFLVDDPGRVIALDLNAHQNHLLRLKIAAFRKLSYRGLLEFLGYRESSSRLETYARLRPLLEDGSRRFWDSRPGDLRKGGDPLRALRGVYAPAEDRPGGPAAETRPRPPAV